MLSRKAAYIFFFEKVAVRLNKWLKQLSKQRENLGTFFLEKFQKFCVFDPSVNWELVKENILESKIDKFLV